MLIDSLVDQPTTVIPLVNALLTIDIDIDMVVVFTNKFPSGTSAVMLSAKE